MQITTYVLTPGIFRAEIKTGERSTLLNSSALDARGSETKGKKEKEDCAWPTEMM